jgi:hypothetical protein
VYVTVGIVGSYEMAITQFTRGGNHPWIHLMLVVLIVLGVPLFVLCVGEFAFWIAGVLGRRTPKAHSN